MQLRASVKTDVDDRDAAPQQGGVLRAQGVGGGGDGGMVKSQMPVLGVSDLTNGIV